MQYRVIKLSFEKLYLLFEKETNLLFTLSQQQQQQQCLRNEIVNPGIFYSANFATHAVFHPKCLAHSSGALFES